MVGLRFAVVQGAVSPLWPPTGLALAALLPGGGAEIILALLRRGVEAAQHRQRDHLVVADQPRPARRPDLVEESDQAGVVKLPT